MARPRKRLPAYYRSWLTARSASQPQQGRERRTILAARLEHTNEQENNMRAGCRPGMQWDDTQIGTPGDRRAAA
ncbi:hypothetical protein F3J12_29225 [Burkholderia sp. Ax-1735]|nr:hypothetical protein [Burkholderia sp. Ap-955]NIF13526.1 hypothetical protein [Burkholderia sp. Ax-1735]NIG06719.1 hypothetical protein [Burkholderia sp. Tr-849]